MKKRLAQALITSVVVGSLIVTPVLAAPTVDELENKKAAAESEVDSLQSQLTALFSKMDELEKELAEKNKELIQAEEDLEAAEEKQQKQYEDMKLRIQYMYEEGDTSALERLADSGSIAEMLSQVEYVQKVHTYDRNMLNEYKETVQEVEDLKTAKEEELQNMEDLQSEYEAQSQEINTTIETKSSEIDNLDEQLQAAIKEAEEKRKAEEEAAAAAAAQQNNTGGTGTYTPSGGGTSGGGSSTPEPSYDVVTGNAIVDRAYSWVGRAEYVWGGCSPGAFDCSGFVSYCLTGSYSRLGTTYTFMGWPQVSNPQPGDVCVSWGHTGIYIGGGQMIHAATYGVGVIVGPVQSDMIYVRY